MKQQELFNEVKEIFTSYLIKNKQRKTAERYTILEEIYKRNDHFDAEGLFIELKKKKINVSRATVYNTLELLQECSLIRKHQFGNNTNLARFEKSFGSRQHDHLICIECNKVMEFCDPRIHQISTRMGELLNYNIENHSLILYGHCRGCESMPQKGSVNNSPRKKKLHAV
ncbi:MAG: transcriptional repressor [Chitinophagales bacterium]|nr:transcriptional repressor [Chitinophagales bacterium]